MALVLRVCGYGQRASLESQTTDASSPGRPTPWLTLSSLFFLRQQQIQRAEFLGKKIGAPNRPLGKTENFAGWAGPGRDPQWAPISSHTNIPRLLTSCCSVPPSPPLRRRRSIHPSLLCSSSPDTISKNGQLDGPRNAARPEPDLQQGPLSLPSSLHSLSLTSFAIHSPRSSSACSVSTHGRRWSTSGMTGRSSPGSAPSSGQCASTGHASIPCSGQQSACE